MMEINTKWFLPAIQRPYVWGNRYEFEKYIQRLFDSLYHNYPIGILILWETEKTIPHRDFLKDIREREVYSNIEDKGVWSRHKSLVYDGQQRLQTLYSCLKYSIFDRLLVFDLNYDEKKDEDSKTGFRFIRKDEEPRPFEIKMNYLFSRKYDQRWEVRSEFLGKIRREEDETEEISKRIERNLDKIWEIFLKEENELLSYYAIPSEFNEERVNDIFERLNTGGITLSNVDLLFAKINEKEPSFQTEIIKFCDEIFRKYHVEFDSNDILQIINMIVRRRVRVSPDVKPETISNIIDVWKKMAVPFESFIKDYLKGQFNITHIRIVRNKLPLFVIIVFFYRLYESGFKYNQLAELTVKAINRFFITSEINDWTLQSYIDNFTNIIMDNSDPKHFPYKAIWHYVSEKDARPTEISEKRFESYRWMALKFLMPDRQFVFNVKSRNRYNPELDHIFPVKLPGKDKPYSDYVDTVWNMQPVDGDINLLKSNRHPLQFFKDEEKDTKGEIINGSKYHSKYDFLPPLDDSLWHDYKEFIEWRKREMQLFLEERYGITLLKDSME